MENSQLSVFLIAGGMLAAVLVSRMATRRRGLDRKLKRLGVKKQTAFGPWNLFFIVTGMVVLVLGLFLRSSNQ